MPSRRTAISSRLRSETVRPASSSSIFAAGARSALFPCSPGGGLNEVAYDGLRLIDTHDWTIKTLDPGPQDFTVAGRLVLARRWAIEGDALSPIGLLAYDLERRPRFRRFPGADVLVLGTDRRYAYVEVRRQGKSLTHVIDLATGRSTRVLPRGPVRLLR